MNPYLAFGLAMCGIVILALAATSYMAMYFNRKAKDDTDEAMQPLADVIDGAVDIEEATVEGRFKGHIAEGKIASLPGGMGRVFSTSLIDGAGGDPWQWTLSRSKEPGGPDSPEWNESVPSLTTEAERTLQSLANNHELFPGWFRVSYDPEAGIVRLDRPMKTRRDIPGPTSFQNILERLYQLAAINRAHQGPTSSLSNGANENVSGR